MDEIYSALAECDLFVAIGTSGNVYPAAGFVEVAGQSGAQSLEINLEESQVASSFNEARYGLAGTVVPEWVDEILAE
jgi:NAD-dependent deacetylase